MALKTCLQTQIHTIIQTLNGSSDAVQHSVISMTDCLISNSVQSTAASPFVLGVRHICAICLRLTSNPLYSLLAARIAPVMAPLVIEFQGSSFPRTFTKPQSIMEKSPPQTAKLPATQTKQDSVKTRSGNLMEN